MKVLFFWFEQNPNWSSVFAPGNELQSYTERVAAKYGIYPHIRFGVSVSRAEFDEQNHCWRIEIDGGDAITARHLVSATGGLISPKMPDIEGIGDFKGKIIHTGHWDDSVDLKGKRVAVIGTGATAVQLVPKIAPLVKRLDVYQSRLNDRDAALKEAEARLAQDRAAFEGEKETALEDIELTKLASQAEARKERAVIANHARTVTAQLDADRAEYLSAAHAKIAEMALEGKELDAAAADLERRENDLAENAGFLKTAFNLLQRAVVVIRDQMKLPISKNLRDTLADIDALATELSVQEDPGPDRPDI